MTKPFKWGISPLLEDISDDAGDLDLIEHVRQTGTLYSGELGSGMQSIGPWYNPAQLRHMGYLNELQRAVLAKAHLRLHRIDKLSEHDRLDKIRAEHAALEVWRAHQDEMGAHMRMAHRYVEMLMVG